MRNKRKHKTVTRLLSIALSVVLLCTDYNLVSAAENISSGDAITAPVEVSAGDAVTAGDAVSAGDTVSPGDFATAEEPTVSDDDAPDSTVSDNTVSDGDATDVTVSDGDVTEEPEETEEPEDEAPVCLPSREPEAFHAEPAPQNYGTLVSYDTDSRTYHVEGDNYVTVVGNDAYTYIDESGILAEVDNTLIANPISSFSMWGEVSTTYINSANDYTVFLPEKLSVPGSTDPGEGITIVSGDYLLTMYPAEGTFTEGLVKDNAIRYNDVFDGIDYQYTVLGNSVKEDIILLEKGEKNSFSYYLDTCGLTASIENNTLFVKDGEEVIFVLEAPEMEDAAGNISFGVKLTLTEPGENGMYLVTVTADADWLAAEERVYPVRIDPSAIQVTGTAIRIACAEEGSPNLAIGDNQYPYVGYDDGITSGNLSGYGTRHKNCRSYFAINYDFAALSGEAEIVSAALQVTQKTRWSGGRTIFGLYGVEEAWEVNSLTWNNQLAYNHYFIDSKAASTTRGESLTFDVTEEVSAWINGTAANNGFVMKAMEEAANETVDHMQCEVFYSNSSASYGPKLIISWTGELTDLSALTLDDTTINIYPVVERNGDKSTTTMGVVAHGLAMPGATVTYSLVNGTTGQTVAQEELVYPDSALYGSSYSNALAYNRRLSNWQSAVCGNLVPGQLYYMTAQASMDGEIGALVTSDTFLIYKEAAFDLIPRIAQHYGVDVNTIMADMRMQDALAKSENLLFIRNPQNTAAYIPGELPASVQAAVDGLLLGRAQNCVFGHDPINLNTGNFYMEQTDVSIADIGGDFTFSRQYNAKGADYYGSLGWGWSMPYDERLGEMEDGSLLWLSGTGSIVTFVKTDTGYSAPAGTNFALTTENDTYVIKNTDTNEKHIFNAYGMLTALTDGAGNRTELTYDINYRLTGILSPSGKRFAVALDGENRISAITLPDGNTITYTYDSAGNLTKVTDEAADTLVYTYDAAHRLTAWYDENGNRVIYNTYDEEDRVIKQELAEGETITLSYEDGKTTSTDANGNVTVYHYDGQFRTTKTEYPDGTTESRSYNDAGYLASVTDRMGVTTTYTYDGAGRVTTETKTATPAGEPLVYSYTYTASGEIATVTDALGAVTTYTYDNQNRLTSITDAEGGVVSYTYDEKNRPVSMTDANGTTTYTYDGANVISMTDAEGGTWTYTYDAMNRQLSVTNPEGETESTTYDAKGRVIAETDGAGGTTAYTFDPAGNVLAITDKEGQTSTFTYDKANRMLQGTDPLGNTLTYTYDKNGNTLTETDALGSVTAYTYDAMNRVVIKTDGAGETTTYAYDGADRIISVTDRRGNSTETTYDAVTGAVSSVTDARLHTTAYETDALGRTTGIIYADGSSVCYTYDKLGRITAITNQIGTTTYLTYDAKGNLTAIYDAEDRIYRYTYDGLNRLVKTENPLGETVTYSYDGAGRLNSETDALGNTTTYAYDKAGNLTALTDALGGVTGYTYDKEGRVASVTTPEGRTTLYTYSAIGELLTMEDAAGNTTGYSYDALSRLLSVTDGMGEVAAYTYDKNGNLTTVTDALGNTHSYRLDAEGNLLTDTYPNGETENYSYLSTGEVSRYTDRYGVVTNLAYDALGRVISAKDTAGNEMTYTYDAAGNVLTATDVLGRTTAYTYDKYGRLTTVTEPDGAVTTYAYDTADRLTSVTDAAGNVTTYAYDGAGNLLCETAPGEAVTAYTYDALHRLVQTVDPEGAATGYAYDKDGNLTANTDGNGIVNTYTYDALNRLLTYTDGNGGNTGYAYDTRSNVTAITTPLGITETYGVDGVGNITSVTNGAGETTTYEYDDLYRLVKTTSPTGAAESYTYDRHDVITGVTDALGAVTTYEINANGAVTARTMANGGRYTYTYDAVNRLTAISTPLGYEKTFTYSLGNDILVEEDNLGRSTAYAYDVLHNLVQVTDANGGITAFTYDERGNLTTETNALGNSVTYTYDKTDRMVTVTDPLSKVATVEYDAAGNVTNITLPGNRTTGYTYDGNYNTVAVTDPMGYVYGYGYDADDRLVSTLDPLAQTTGYAYDNANRLTAYTDKMGLTESYTYDPAGNVRSYTDTDGLTTTYVYDLKNRLTGVTSPVREGEVSALTAVYTYDEMDNLTAVTDYAGRTTAYTYDLEGNLTSVTDASGRTEIMTYDVAGRLTSYTSNGGNTVSYDYDKLNNLVEKSYTDATGTQAAEDVVYAYDALGQRVEMFDSTGDTEYTYDALGRITSVTTYRTENGRAVEGDIVTYTYDEADNLSAITYPDGTSVLYEYDLNDNLTKVTDREGNETTYVYDAINRITEIHRPNGISTYHTYNARNQITELINTCDDCEWVVSNYAYTYDDKGFIIAETAIESLAGYAYDDKHDGKHEDGKHDDLYPHGTAHSGKHDADATFAYQIIQTDRTFTYDDAGKLLSATETEDNYGTYTYTYEYDLMGNRTAIVKTDADGEVAESRYYTYNDSNQLTEVELYNGKKTTTVSYEYDADGNLISETGKDETDKVELTYTYTVENRLEAVYDADELLMAAAYDGDGNRIFQLNYNLHTDEDWKGNSGNGNGSNKDNSGSGSSSSSSDTEEDSTEDTTTGGTSTEDSSDSDSDSTGNNGNGNNKYKTKNGNSSANNGKGGNGKNATTTTTVEETTESEEETTVSDISADNSTADSASAASTGNGNATNAETNNSQNQCGILFPIDSETSDTEEYLIGLIKTTGKEKNYELIEYINDVNREYTEVLVEQNINGADDTTYVYGVDRLSLDRFDGSTGYYLYDPRGSVTGITNEDGQIYQSYRYNANGEITFGAPQYENEYTYNGESYNPNIESQYLRARYYDVTTAAFITEDSYLGDITEPLTLNRYNYCVSSPLNYVDKSGHWVEEDMAKAILDDPSIAQKDKGYEIYKRVQFYKSLISVSFKDANYDYVMGFDYEGNQEYFDEVISKAQNSSLSNGCSVEEAFAIAVQITTMLEGNYGVANNSDGQGMSIGRVQSNLGTGSLQKVLSYYFNEYPDSAQEVLGEDRYDMLSNVIQMSRKEAVKWASELQNPSKRDENSYDYGEYGNWEEWKIVLKEMSQTEEYKEAEDNTIIREKMGTAQTIISNYNITTVRGYALAFDYANHGWYISDENREKLKEDSKNLSQREIQERIVEYVSAALKDKDTAEDYIERGEVIINGRGNCHGTYFDFEDMFGLSDAIVVN